MPVGLIRHKIYDRLRADILSCELSPGREIREGELAERFGVSKSPVRDALQRLELEGLVEIEPRRGHRISPISVSDAADILDLREILEAAALRTIAEKASAEALAGLDALRVAKTTDKQVFSSYNRQFHLAICEAAGNNRLTASVAQLMENYDRLCIVSLSSADQPEAMNMEEALADHNTIVDALQARNARAAVRASARHIRTSRRRVIRGLEARQIVP